MAQLSARVVEREALRVEVVPPAVTAQPSAVSHAVVAARSAVRELEVVALGAAALHGAGEPRVAQVRRAAGSDEQVQFSAAVLSALSLARFQWVAQPAQTGPAQIERAMASSSARRQ